MTNLRTIHLVDDDESIRHSASFMLRHAGFVVKTYVDGVNFLEHVSDADEGCILLDVRMPILDGLAVQKKLNEKAIALPVIVLTGHGDVAIAVEAMKNGAVDFLEKPYEKHALLRAIETSFDRLEDAGNQESRKNKALAQISKLTPREHDVLLCLVDGATNKAIAEKLDISARTVEIHRANLMEKLDADSLSTVLRTAFSAELGFTSNDVE